MGGVEQKYIRIKYMDLQDFWENHGEHFTNGALITGVFYLTGFVPKDKVLNFYRRL